MKLVHGYPNLRKDSNGVIQNVQLLKEISTEQTKRMALQQRESQSEIQDLKSELQEVKDLLHQLLKNNGTELST